MNKNVKSRTHLLLSSLVSCIYTSIIYNLDISI